MLTIAVSKKLSLGLIYISFFEEDQTYRVSEEKIGGDDQNIMGSK